MERTLSPFSGAVDGARTRDSLLGRQVLYRLSYYRMKRTAPQYDAVGRSLQHGRAAIPLVGSQAHIADLHCAEVAVLR